MRAFKQITAILLMGIGLLSCKTDTPPIPVEPVNTLKLTVQPVYGGETLYLDSTYQTAEGYDVQFTDFRFYMHDVRNGSTSFKDVSLYDYRARGIDLINVQGDKADFTSLQANLGVGADVNHNDPVGAFDPDSWLYISNANDMHWDWNPGYIFVKVEAKVDTIPDGNALFNHNVVFHVGKDENLQTLSFDNIQWMSEGTGYVFPLKLDLQQFLSNNGSNIDLKTEFTSHTLAGQEALSTQIVVNFKDALTPY